jgi:hypothetical protein
MIQGSSRPEEQLSLRNRVAEDARRQYESLGGAPLHTTIFFSVNHSLRMRRLPSLVAELTRILLSYSPGLAIYESTAISSVTDDRLPEEVDLVSISRMPAKGYGVWHPSLAAWTSCVDQNDLVRIIDSAGKESLVPAYLKKCEIIWLLIVFNFMPDGNHSTFRPPSDPIPFSLRTRFDRVFCLDVFSLHSVSIPTCRPSEAT